MTTRADRKKAYRRGHLAEWVAIGWLSLKGYRILAHRYKTGVGEVDVIARRRRTIAFVEVKFRRTNEDALLAVTPGGQKRIIAASRTWLSGMDDVADCVFRYDILTIAPWRIPLHHVSAFEANTS